MKTIFRNALALMLGITLQAQADIVGNGAKGVVIEGQETKQVYLLDLYELSQHEDLSFPEEYAGKDPMGALPMISKVLTQLSPETQNLVSQKLNEIYSMDRVLALSLLQAMNLFQWGISPAALLKTDDNKTAADLALVQLAVRRGGRILLSGRFWPTLKTPAQEVALNSRHQAAVILHELVYSLIRPQSIYRLDDSQYHDLQSERTRELVSLIFERPLKEWSYEAFFERVNSELPMYASYKHWLLGSSDLRLHHAGEFSPYIPGPRDVPARISAEGLVVFHPKVFLAVEINGRYAEFTIPLGLDKEQTEAELKEVESYFEKHLSFSAPSPTADPFSAAPEEQPEKVDLATSKVRGALSVSSVALKFQPSSQEGLREILWPQQGELERENEILGDKFHSLIPELSSGATFEDKDYTWLRENLRRAVALGQKLWSQANATTESPK